MARMQQNVTDCGHAQPGVCAGLNKNGDLATHNATALDYRHSDAECTQATNLASENVEVVGWCGTVDHLPVDTLCG